MSLIKIFKLPTVRNWATPLVTAAFILMMCTGVMMFFELESFGVITVVHQWFSWILLLGVAGHITANFKPLKKHLKTSWGIYSVLLFLTIFGLSLFSWGIVTGPQLERPIELALVDAPLSALADVVGISPNVLMEKFRIQGIEASATQSIREVVMLTGIDENDLLGIVFLAD